MRRGPPSSAIQYALSPLPSPPPSSYYYYHHHHHYYYYYYYYYHHHHQVVNEERTSLICMFVFAIQYALSAEAKDIKLFYAANLLLSFSTL